MNQGKLYGSGGLVVLDLRALPRDMCRDIAGEYPLHDPWLVAACLVVHCAVLLICSVLPIV